MINYDYYEDKYIDIKHQPLHRHGYGTYCECARCSSHYPRHKSSWKDYREVQYREKKVKVDREQRNGEHWRYRNQRTYFSPSMKAKIRWFENLGPKDIGFYLRRQSVHYQILDVSGNWIKLYQNGWLDPRWLQYHNFDRVTLDKPTHRNIL